MNSAEPTTEGTPAAHEQHESRSRGLLSASFQGLLFTQLFTATNDNIFRWLVIGIGKDFADPGKVLAAGTACFVFPYLFLAAIAGYLQARSGRRFAVVVLQNHTDVHRGPGEEVQEAVLRWVYEQ